MKKISLLIVVIILAMVTTTFVMAKEANEPVGQEEKKVTICHRNQGETEYIEQTIAKSAVVATHYYHQWGDDIIPQFVYDGTTYAAKGAPQAWLASGCKEPTPPPSKDDATASVVRNECGEGDTSTKVTISFTGMVSAVITGPNGYSNTLLASDVLVGLAPGSYSITFNVDTTNFNNPGNLPTSFEVLVCEEEKEEETDATASVVRNECGVGDTSTKVDISFSGVESASITGPQNDTIYTSSTLLNWPVGVYNITFKVDTENYNDPGGLDTSFEVLLCEQEKEEEEKEEEKKEESPAPAPAPSVAAKPDVAAGGNGPSLISMLTPIMIGLSEAAMVASLIKGRIIKRK